MDPDASSTNMVGTDDASPDSDDSDDEEEDDEPSSATAGRKPEPANTGEARTSAAPAAIAAKRPPNRPACAAQRDRVAHHEPSAMAFDVLLRLNIICSC
jgi:hypothetical protein